MSTGRKTKSDDEKKTKGTYRPDRGQQPMSGEPLAELPPPDTLTAAGKEIWESIRPQLEGVVTAAEIHILEIYCNQTGLLRDAARKGEHIKSQDLAQLRGFAASFGLLPAERARVPKKKKPVKESPFQGM